MFSLFILQKKKERICVWESMAMHPFGKEECVCARTCTMDLISHLSRKTASLNQSRRNGKEEGRLLDFYDFTRHKARECVLFLKTREE